MEKTDKNKKADEPVFELKEAADQIAKSIYKSILKTLKRRSEKQAANKVVNDVLDNNNVAQVDPDEIPSRKDRVLYKGSKHLKLKRKGVKKLKKFMDRKCQAKKITKDEPIPGLVQKKLSNNNL